MGRVWQDILDGLFEQVGVGKESMRNIRFAFSRRPAARKIFAKNRRGSGGVDQIPAVCRKLMAITAKMETSDGIRFRSIVIACGCW